MSPVPPYFPRSIIIIPQHRPSTPFPNSSLENSLGKTTTWVDSNCAWARPVPVQGDEATETHDHSAVSLMSRPPTAGEASTLPEIELCSPGPFALSLLLTVSPLSSHLLPLLPRLRSPPMAQLPVSLRKLKTSQENLQLHHHLHQPGDTGFRTYCHAVAVGAHNLLKAPPLAHMTNVTQQVPLSGATPKHVICHACKQTCVDPVPYPPWEDRQAPCLVPAAVNTGEKQARPRPTKPSPFSPTAHQRPSPSSPHRNCWSRSLTTCTLQAQPNSQSLASARHRQHLAQPTCLDHRPSQLWRSPALGFGHFFSFYTHPLLASLSLML